MAITESWIKSALHVRQNHTGMVRSAWTMVAHMSEIFLKKYLSFFMDSTTKVNFINNFKFAFYHEIVSMNAVLLTQMFLKCCALQQRYLIPFCVIPGILMSMVYAILYHTYVISLSYTITKLLLLHMYILSLAKRISAFKFQDSWSNIPFKSVLNTRLVGPWSAKL